MDWFRMDVDWPRDPKVVKAGPEGALLFFAAVGYCAEQETDGEVLKFMIPVLCPPELVKRPRRAAQAVTRAGLWIEDLGGTSYFIPAFTRKNPSHDEQEAKREQADRRRAQTRKRVAAWRAKQTDGASQESLPNGLRDGVTNAANDTERYETGPDDQDPGTLITSRVQPEGGSGGEPDVFDEIRVPNGLNPTQAHLWRKICASQPLFRGIWPDVFVDLERATSAAAITEALQAMADADLSTVDRPQAYLYETVRDHAKPEPETRRSAAKKGGK